VNWDTWVNLLREDREWLLRQPRTLEREHLVGLLDHLMESEQGKVYYEAFPGSPRVRAARRAES
jgi:hypothetical protein